MNNFIGWLADCPYKLILFNIMHWQLMQNLELQTEVLMHFSSQKLEVDFYFWTNMFIAMLTRMVTVEEHNIKSWTFTTSQKNLTPIYISLKLQTMLNCRL